MASEEAPGGLHRHPGDLDPSTPDDSRRAERRLGRGIEDVSHLFLSHVTEDARPKPEAPAGTHEPSPAKVVRAPFIAEAAAVAALSREQLAVLLGGNTAALEEGMRTIDVSIPCDPYSPIDVLAIDVANRLTIIDVETAANDGMLLRGLCHFDWLVRNMRLSRRLYHGHVINGTAVPRVYLVAPHFSPMLATAAQRIASPQVTCVRFHTLTVGGATGILLDRA
jgi:hypothetical protein